MKPRVFCGDCKHRRFEEWDRSADNVCKIQGAMKVTPVIQYMVYPLCRHVNKHNDCSLFEWSRWKRFLHFVSKGEKPA